MKMESLETNRQMLTLLCLCPNEVISAKKKLVYAISTIVIIIIAICTFASSFAYFLKYLSNDLEKSLQTLYLAVAVMSYLDMFLAMFFSRNKIKAIYDDLTVIYRECKIRWAQKQNALTEFLWFSIKF